MVSRRKPRSVENKPSTDSFVMADGRIGRLSPSQLEALNEVEGIRNASPKYGEVLIVGPAGTGKSTIVRELLRRWRYIHGEGRVVLSSPTHRANWVLRSMSAYKTKRFGTSVVKRDDPLTLEALMGAKPNELTGRFVYPSVDAAIRSHKPPPITKMGRRSVLIVDEASMMDHTELHRIRQWRDRLGFVVVYIGDVEQLPPVGMDKSPVFAAGIMEVRLTEVMRQRGGNPLLDLLTDVRLGKNPPVIANLNDRTGEGVVLVQNRAAALQAITSLSSPDIVRANMNQLRVLAGRNKVVRDWNGMVHGILFPSGTSPVSRGEVVIGYRNTEELRNGVEYLVDHVSELKSFTHSGSGFAAKGWDVVLKSDPDSSSKVRVFLVSKEHEDRYVHQVQMMSDRKQEAWQAWHDSGRDKTKVKAAIMATKNLEDFIGKVGIMNDISIDWTAGNLEESEKSSLRRMFDLGYASTVHKAQGGTVNVVVVDMDDVSSFPGDPQFKRKLVYTALSRASKAAVIMGSSFVTSEGLLESLVRIGSLPSFYSVMQPSFVVEDASCYGKGFVPPAGQGSLPAVAGHEKILLTPNRFLSILSGMSLAKDQ